MVTSKKLDRCPTCGRKSRRSNPANALYWVLLHQVAEKVKPGQMTYSADQWHQYFKSRFLGCDDVKLPNGKVLVMPRSSADLDVADFGDYMDKVQAWAAERDVYLDSLEQA